MGGSILVKRGQEFKTVFRQKVIDNRWMNITPFAKDTVQRWKQDMSIDILRENGRVIGFHNYDESIYPYDMKGIDGITNIVPEFELLAGYYQDILHRHFQFRYFGTLCDYMKSLGYVSKENLYGLPYDSRLILDVKYRQHYFDTIRETIEEANKRPNEKNFRKPAIVSHSLGGVLLKWFLTEHVTEEWIDEHIHKIYIMNSPFGGTSMALRVILSGEYYVPMFNQEFKDPLQKMSAIIMCLPNKYAYESSESLVKVDEGSEILTINSFQHHPNVAFEIWRDLYQPHLETIMKPLHLPVHCDILLGTQKETLQKFKIRKEGEMPYFSKFELGDGQVPTRSLYLAKKVLYGKHVQTTEIADANHIDIISHPIFIDKITQDCIGKHIPKTK